MEADILMSYSGDDILMLIARLLFGISIITIYPIIVLLGRLGTQDIIMSLCTASVLRRPDHITTHNMSFAFNALLILEDSHAHFLLLSALFINRVRPLDCCAFKSEISQIHPENLCSESFLAGGYMPYQIIPCGADS